MPKTKNVSPHQSQRSNAGADVLVIGRAITGAADPVQACEQILASLK